jgi:hypothetical protein
MKDEKIRQFNGDRNGKKEILDYVLNFLNKRILEEAYRGGDVKSLAGAVTELKKAFDQMDIDYAIPTKQEKPINEAR